MKLPDFVKARRDQLGLSIRDVAGIAGMSPAGYHDIEMGKPKDVYVTTITRLAKALKVRPAVIFQATVNMLDPDYEEPRDDVGADL